LLPYLVYLITWFAFVSILFFILKLKIKLIFKFIINILLGGAILFLINYIPGVNITLDIFKSIVVGVFGIPGAIVVIVYYFLIEK